MEAGLPLALFPTLTPYTRTELTCCPLQRAGTPRTHKST